MPQECPRAPKERPREHQESPKRGQKGPKSAPRASKSAPRAAPKRPGAPSTPRKHPKQYITHENMWKLQHARKNPQRERLESHALQFSQQTHPNVWGEPLPDLKI